MNYNELSERALSNVRADLRVTLAISLLVELFWQPGRECRLPH